MKRVIKTSVIELIQGDITEQDTDAIVNAANTHLILGGGVAGAIRRKGGPAIQAECDRKSPIAVGQAAITSGGNLKARFVIHAAGPQMGESDEDRKLKEATLNSLKRADEYRLKSMAFCAISAGIFGFPMDRCATIMLGSTIEYLRGSTDIERVVFCLYDTSAYHTFASEMQRRLPEKLSGNPSCPSI